MSTVYSPCRRNYFVHLTERGTPIVDTMFSKNNNKIDAGYKCREARLPNTQMTVPVGNVQCFFGTRHLRYFYKVSKITNEILPNSMWSQSGKPSSMCSGTFNILEYIIWK